MPHEGLRGLVHTAQHKAMSCGGEHRSNAAQATVYETL